jgi:exodeoxyribonuclease VII large subunit
LFAPERKRPLPKYPQRIGLVTSPTGAAIRDVLHVVQRRNPALEIILAPCRVQGEGAAEEVAEAIRRLNAWNVLQVGRAAPGAPSSSVRPGGGPGTARPTNAGIDLILVTRGGGSLEDLWAFNEEIVARAIFESSIPVVSAIGHEIDFTISDFVADVRAATPSAAAEIITEGVFASRDFVAEAHGLMTQRIRRRLEREREDLEHLTLRVARAHPRRRLNEKLQVLDDLQTTLLRAGKSRWRERVMAWQTARQRLARVRPAQLLLHRREAVRDLQSRLDERRRNGFKNVRHRLATVEARLRLLSPANVLERGYSITTHAATGKILRDAGEAKPGQRLRTRLKRGEIRSVVEE